VANDIGRPGIGMNADDNAILLIGATGTRLSFGPAPKSEVADFVLKNICPP